ncbi:MAG: 50S ribosomal protein L3 [Parcubacteria group bacterium GW2011_GWF2_44_7]|nr:MAG: 50S ribosomal protein L3 [Parcubacteria group bacterium GW2011_GWF2_44_7]
MAQVKTQEKDGYESVQIGFGEKKDKHTNKPQMNHFKKANVKNLRYLKEFKIEKPEMVMGAELKADIFAVGDNVKVSGLSKGKGFQGVVKRHGFRGGPKSHGQKHSLRAPGSIGATFPERVPKGRRMAGRMGYERVTQEGLKIVAIDAENNIIAIKGAVPGRRGTLLEIISEE